MADKPFDRPFDMLTAPSKVEGLTALSEVEGRPWHPTARLSFVAPALLTRGRLTFRLNPSMDRTWRR
jgi:hypothetical protein